MSKALRVLKRGDSGEDVKFLQKILRSQGYFIGIPRGNFRQLTENAVLDFQAQHIDPFTGEWLDADGVVGPITWRAILDPTGPSQRSNIKPLSANLFIGSSREIEQRVAVLRWFNKEYRNGVKEVPDGSNWGPRVKDYLENLGIGPNPWCMAFGVFGHEKILGQSIERTASVMTWTQEARQRGMFFPKTRYRPIPGDAGIMSYGNWRGHWFVVTGVDESGYNFNTIAGNEGNRVKYGLRNKGISKLIGFVNIFGDQGRTKYHPRINNIGSADNSQTDTR